MSKKNAIISSLAGLCIVVGGACSSSSKSAGPSPAATNTMPTDMQADAGAPSIPFHAVAAAAYVAKVKNVLIGLPPTDEEVKRVEADPSQLKALISAWMKLPEYGEKMKRFFELAYQQTQVSEVDFDDQSYPRKIALNNTTTPLLIQNATQSFARTMLQLIGDGRPLTDGVTTTRLMMTIALRELYAFLDVWEVDDDGKVTDRFKNANPRLSLTIEAAAGPIPIVDTLDPTSPNFMHWYNPDTSTNQAKIPGCAEDPIVIPASGIALHYLNAACGGDDSGLSAFMAGGGASGTDASIDASSNSGGAAGSSNGGGGSPSAGGSSGSSASTGGSGGNTVADASQAKDSGGGAKKDGGKTGADGGCTQAAEDKCDSCTEKHCCAQLDMCDANATCSVAYTAIDACIGDSSSAATVKQCYQTFSDTHGTGQTAKKLYDCVVAQCMAQCRP